MLCPLLFMSFFAGAIVAGDTSKAMEIDSKHSLQQLHTDLRRTRDTVNHMIEYSRLLWQVNWLPKQVVGGDMLVRRIASFLPGRGREFMYVCDQQHKRLQPLLKGYHVLQVRNHAELLKQVKRLPKRAVNGKELETLIVSFLMGGMWRSPDGTIEQIVIDDDMGWMWLTDRLLGSITQNSKLGAFGPKPGEVMVICNFKRCSDQTVRDSYKKGEDPSSSDEEEEHVIQEVTELRRIDVRSNTVLAFCELPLEFGAQEIDLSIPNQITVPGAKKVFQIAIEDLSNGNRTSAGKFMGYYDFVKRLPLCRYWHNRDCDQWVGKKTHQQFQSPKEAIASKKDPTCVIVPDITRATLTILQGNPPKGWMLSQERSEKSFGVLDTPAARKEFLANFSGRVVPAPHTLFVEEPGVSEHIKRLYRVYCDEAEPTTRAFQFIESEGDETLWVDATPTLAGSNQKKVPVKRRFIVMKDSSSGAGGDIIFNAGRIFKPASESIAYKDEWLRMSNLSGEKGWFFDLEKADFCHALYQLQSYFEALQSTCRLEKLHVPRVIIKEKRGILKFPREIELSKQQAGVWDAFPEEWRERYRSYADHSLYIYSPHSKVASRKRKAPPLKNCHNIDE